MKTALVIFTYLLATLSLHSQVNMFPAYSQNFGSADISGTWTDNATFAGWYSNRTTINHQDVTVAAPSNTGALYSYECNGNNDEKLGGRASGGTGTIRFGLRMVNNSSSTIHFIRITFDAFQFSLADDCGLQTLTFSYMIASPANNINLGGYTLVPSLGFGALQTNGGSCGTTQLSGFPCTQTTNLTTCITVNIPPSSEIMFKWEDIDDPGNDHHMGIDNVSVTSYTNDIYNPSNNCISPLPVELTDFAVMCEENMIKAEWQTESEINNDHFTIQGSADAIEYTDVAFVSGNGNSNVPHHYQTYLERSNLFSYYRLNQVDYNGEVTTYSPQHLTCSKEETLLVNFYNGEFTIMFPSDMSENISLNMYDLNGRNIFSTRPPNGSTMINCKPVENLSAGIYLISLVDESKGTSYCAKIFIPL